MLYRFFSKSISILVFLSEYGGYRDLSGKKTIPLISLIEWVCDVTAIWITYDAKNSAIGFKLLTKTDFLCENVSYEYFPWYEPIPLMPTPPNGNVSTKNKNN